MLIVDFASSVGHKKKRRHLKTEFYGNININQEGKCFIFGDILHLVLLSSLFLLR